MSTKEPNEKRRVAFSSVELKYGLISFQTLQLALLPNTMSAIHVL